MKLRWSAYYYFQYAFCLFCVSHRFTHCSCSFDADNNQNGFSQSAEKMKFIIDGVQVKMPTEKFYDFTKGEGKLSASPVLFDPPFLDFKERAVGQPHIEHVTVMNADSAQTLHLISIFASTPHFHSSFFHNKQVTPGSNTTFDVVFLPRTVGSVQNTLFIHTTTGILSYSVQGVGVASPYRLQAFFNVRIPLNASFAPLLHIHNPHPVVLQIVEMFTHGGDLHLELPHTPAASSSEAMPRSTSSSFSSSNSNVGESASKQLWRIPPYETRTVMRLRMLGLREGNHTAFVKIRCNISTAPDTSTSPPMDLQGQQGPAGHSVPPSSSVYHTLQFILPVEVEVTTKPGLFHLLDQLNFGLIRGLDQPKTLRLVIVNTFPVPALIKSVTLSSRNDAVEIEVRSTKLMSGYQRSTVVAFITFNAAKAQSPSQWSGHIIVESFEPAYRLLVPYSATVLHGSVVYDANITKFYSGRTDGENETRSIPLTNTFQMPLAVYSVTLQGEALKHFTLISFTQPMIIGAQGTSDFIRLCFHPLSTQSQFISQMLIYTNASLFVIPLFVYHGKLKVIPHRPEVHPGQLDFGTLGKGEQRTLLFTVRNENPVDVQVRQLSTQWEQHAELILYGIERGNGTTLSYDHGPGKRPVTSLMLRPYHFAVLALVVNAPQKEHVYDKKMRLATQFETLSISYKLKIAEGSLTAIPDVLILEDSFPTRRSSCLLRLRSTFEEFTELKLVHFQPHDPRFTFEPSPGRQLPLLLKPMESTVVGRVNFDPLQSCMDSGQELVANRHTSKSSGTVDSTQFLHGTSLTLPSALRRGSWCNEGVNPAQGCAASPSEHTATSTASSKTLGKVAKSVDTPSSSHTRQQTRPVVPLHRECYVGFDVRTLVGCHWLSSLALEWEQRVWELDLSIYQQLRQRWEAFHLADEHSVNVSMVMDTVHVKGFLNHVQAAMIWPTFLRVEDSPLVTSAGSGNSHPPQAADSSSSENSEHSSTVPPVPPVSPQPEYPSIVSTVIRFPITQLGNTTEQALQVQNPTDEVLLVQVIPIALYPKAAYLLERLGIFGGDVEVDDPDLFTVHYMSDIATSESESHASSTKSNSHTFSRTSSPTGLSVNETSALFDFPSACHGSVLTSSFATSSKLDTDEVDMDEDDDDVSQEKPAGSSPTSQNEELPPSHGTLCLAVPPRGVATVIVRFRPKKDLISAQTNYEKKALAMKQSSHSLLVVRNNLTGLETAWLQGRGAVGRLEFRLPPMESSSLMENAGGVVPTMESLNKVGLSPSILQVNEDDIPATTSSCNSGKKTNQPQFSPQFNAATMATASITPSSSSSAPPDSSPLFLHFELTERHLRICEQSVNSKTFNFPLPVRRHFVIYNTGELPVYVRGFSFGPSSLPAIHSNLGSEDSGVSMMSSSDTSSSGFLSFGGGEYSPLPSVDRDEVARSGTSSSVRRIQERSGMFPFSLTGQEESWCSGYGFTVLHCESFVLPVNSSRKFVVAFTPDFSLHHIQQSLFVHTSLGPPYDIIVQATLPMHMLGVCSRAIPRPEMEPLMWYFFFTCCVFVLVAVLLMAYLDADRMYRRDAVKRQQYALEYSLRYQPDPRRVFDLNNLHYSFTSSLMEGDNSEGPTSQPVKESSILRCSESEGDLLGGREGDLSRSASSATLPVESSRSDATSPDSVASCSFLRQRVGAVTPSFELNKTPGISLLSMSQMRGRGRSESSSMLCAATPSRVPLTTYSATESTGALSVGKNRRGFWGALWQWICSFFWWSIYAEQRRNALKPKLGHPPVLAASGGSATTIAEGSTTSGTSTGPGGKNRPRYGSQTSSSTAATVTKKSSPNNSPKSARTRANKTSTNTPPQSLQQQESGSNSRRLAGKGSSGTSVASPGPTSTSSSTTTTTNFTSPATSVLDFAPIEIPARTGGATTFRVHKAGTKISLATVAPVRRKQQPPPPQPQPPSSMSSSSQPTSIVAASVVAASANNMSSQTMSVKPQGMDDDPDEALVLQRSCSSISDNEDDNTSASLIERGSSAVSSLSASLSSNREQYVASQQQQHQQQNKSTNPASQKSGNASRPRSATKQTIRGSKKDSMSQNNTAESKKKENSALSSGKRPESDPKPASGVYVEEERLSKEDDGNDAEDEDEGEQQASAAQSSTSSSDTTGLTGGNRNGNTVGRQVVTSAPNSVRPQQRQPAQVTPMLPSRGVSRKHQQSHPPPPPEVTNQLPGESKTDSLENKIPDETVVKLTQKGKNQHTPTSIVKPVVQQVSHMQPDRCEWMANHETMECWNKGQVDSHTSESFHSMEDLSLLTQSSPFTSPFESANSFFSNFLASEEHSNVETNTVEADDMQLPLWDVDVTTLQGVDTWADMAAISDYTQRVSTYPQEEEVVSGPSMISIPPALSMMYPRESTGGNTKPSHMPGKSTQSNQMWTGSSGTSESTMYTYPGNTSVFTRAPVEQSPGPVTTGGRTATQVPMVHGYAAYPTAAVNVGPMPAIPISAATYHRRGLASFQAALPAALHAATGATGYSHAAHNVMVPTSHLLTGSHLQYGAMQAPSHFPHPHVMPPHCHSSGSMYHPAAQTQPHSNPAVYFTGNSASSSLANDNASQGYMFQTSGQRVHQMHGMDETGDLTGYHRSTTTPGHQHCELLRMTQDRRQSMLEHERRIQATSARSTSATTTASLTHGGFAHSDTFAVDFEPLIEMEDTNTGTGFGHTLSELSLTLGGDLDDEPDWMMTLDSSITASSANSTLPLSLGTTTTAGLSYTGDPSSHLMEDTSLMYESAGLRVWEAMDYVPSSAELNSLDANTLTNLLPANLLPSLNPPAHENISTAAVKPESENSGSPAMSAPP